MRGYHGHFTTYVLACMHTVRTYICTYVRTYVRKYTRRYVRTYVIVEGVLEGTLSMDNIAQHILHPDDKGIIEEGQELQDVDDSDEEPQSTRPQTEIEAQATWAALLNDDWRETADSALVPAEPGDDPTVVAEAEDASPRFRSPPRPRL